MRLEDYATQGNTAKVYTDESLKKMVANSGKDDTIKLSSTGNGYKNIEPYSSRGIELPDNVKEYMNSLKNEGQFIEGVTDSFTEQEISAMSRETGAEYARITIDDKAYLARGANTGMIIPEQLEKMLKQSGGTLDFHTHPFEGDLIPSKDDRSSIARLEKITGQKTSKIITADGQISIFSKDGVLETSTVKVSVDKKYEKMINELFGGGEQG